MSFSAAAKAPVVELSVVMPCLNEALTVGDCVRLVQSVLQANQISGEVIVADNGSNDGSQGIARALGATVVDVSSRGYGAALMGGIEASRGQFVIMGDADSSYNFADIPIFLNQL